MSGWFDWMWNALAWLGLANKEGSLLFLGLDNAGKTSLTGVLRTGKFLAHEPTRHPQLEDLTIHGINIKAFDLGGHIAARRLWVQYLPNIDGVVFIVDATDQKRFAESADNLHELLEQCAPNVPFAILGNKIDLRGACTEDELKQSLSIDTMCTGKEGAALGPNERPIEVFMCSIKKRGGFDEAFQWLAKYF